MKTTLRVGFDLDGVCFDFAESVRRYMRSCGLDKIYKGCEQKTRNWDFFTAWGMDRETFLQICNDGADAGYVFRGGTRPGAVEAMNTVKALGHTVVIITDRSFGKTPEVSHNATRLWLADNGLMYDELYFSPDKTCVPTDTFVEDKLQNYDALAAVGTDAYLVNRDWNAPYNDGRNRIDNVWDYARAIAAERFQSTENGLTISVN